MEEEEEEETWVAALQSGSLVVRRKESWG